MRPARRRSMLVGMIEQLATHHPEPVSVFVAARHDGVRAALWSLLDGEPGIEPLAATADAADLARLLGRVAPAVVVVDEALFADTGMGRLATLVAAAPRTAFIVVGMHDHPGYAARALEAGAGGYRPPHDA